MTGNRALAETCEDEFVLRLGRELFAKLDQMNYGMRLKIMGVHAQFLEKMGGVNTTDQQLYAIYRDWRDGKDNQHGEIGEQARKMFNWYLK